MASDRIAPYGTWKSDITAEKAAAQVRLNCNWTDSVLKVGYITYSLFQSLSAGIEDVLLDLVTGKVYYGQVRPEEGTVDVVLCI